MQLVLPENLQLPSLRTASSMKRGSFHIESNRDAGCSGPWMAFLPLWGISYQGVFSHIGLMQIFPLLEASACQLPWSSIWIDTQVLHIHWCWHLIFVPTPSKFMILFDWDSSVSTLYSEIVLWFPALSPQMHSPGSLLLNIYCHFKTLDLFNLLWKFLKTTLFKEMFAWCLLWVLYHFQVT